jgi:hypothetical protein
MVIAPEGTSTITVPGSLPENRQLPAGWTYNEQTGVVEPAGLFPAGVPRPGYAPHFAPIRRYSDYNAFVMRGTLTDAQAHVRTLPIGFDKHWESKGWNPYMFGFAELPNGYVLAWYCGRELSEGRNNAQAAEVAARIAPVVAILV